MPSTQNVTSTNETVTPTTSEAEPRRMHVALDTRDVAAASRFYQAFFDTPPVKQKPRYAKFAIDDPPLALALIESGSCAPQGAAGLNHLGIQVASSDAVTAAIERLTRAGLAEKVEQDVDCCYARQDKVWARDPDGNRWEVYAVLGEAAQLETSSPATTPVAGSEEGACCGPSCC